MNPDDLPIAGELLEVGAEDPVFDWLLLAGPFLIILVAIAGRSLLTTGIAIGYLLLFLTYVLYQGTSSAI